MIIEKEQLKVVVAENREQLGEQAAEAVFEIASELLQVKDVISMIFAAAPSQNEFLEALLKKPLDWGRIIAFHMDEYIGLPKDAPQAFGVFLKEKLFGKVQFKEVYYLNGDAGDPQAECARYASLLSLHPPDIVCLGIGENTHLAFNDPHVADFRDSLMVKIVDLDEQCRQQQVNDGCFENVDAVPTHALTLTVPALFNATYAFCMVPGSNKARAVHHTLYEEVTEQYPSTILRKHPNAVLYLDNFSSEFV